MTPYLDLFRAELDMELCYSCSVSVTQQQLAEKVCAFLYMRPISSSDYINTPLIKSEQKKEIIELVNERNDELRRVKKVCKNCFIKPENLAKIDIQVKVIKPLSCLFPCSII